MNHILNHTLAAVFACALAFGSIGTIVTVPSAQAEVPAVLALPVIA